MPLRIANYVQQDDASPDQMRVSALVDDLVVDFERLKKACESVESECAKPECWQSALGLVTCQHCLDAAGRYMAWYEQQDEQARRGLGMSIEAVTLLPPVPHPGKVFCLAQNFPSHVEEADELMRGEKAEPTQRRTPKVFMKPSPNTVCGPGDPILISPNAKFIDYEAEMAIVIGDRCKYVEPEEAGAYIAAVTCFNDVSERELDLLDWRGEEEWDLFFYWLNGKWMDNFAPMGPCLAPAGNLDLDDLDVKCTVSGELLQQGNTGEMFHSAAETVSYISQMLTLERGDVIALGTPAGVGKARGRKLVPGDEVIVEVEGVGKLINPVVAEDDIG